jgi:hypothetical protein
LWVSGEISSVLIATSPRWRKCPTLSLVRGNTYATTQQNGRDLPLKRPYEESTMA